MDIDRIRMNDGYVYVWYLTDLIKPTESGIMSVKGYWEIDCKAFRFKTLTYIFYKQPMGEGESNVISRDNPEWIYPLPDSSTESTLNTVCAQ